MKTLSLAAIALSLCICSVSFAQDDAAMQEMTGTAKITKAPAVETKAAMLCATAFVKAADYAPEGGWGEKDYDEAYQAMGMNGGMKVVGFLTEKKLETAGPMFAVWYEDPETTKPQDLTSKWCAPLKADADPAPGVVIEHFPEVMAVTCTYTGHYNTAMNAWGAMMKYAEENNLDWAGNPMEVFHKSFHETQNPDELVTEIVWPCKKKEAAAEEKSE